MSDILMAQLEATSDWLSIREAAIGRLEEKLKTLRTELTRVSGAPRVEREIYWPVLCRQVEDATRQLELARSWKPGAVPERTRVVKRKK